MLYDSSGLEPPSWFQILLTVLQIGYVSASVMTQKAEPLKNIV